jgi:hypothetical protein
MTVTILAGGEGLLAFGESSLASSSVLSFFLFFFFIGGIRYDNVTSLHSSALALTPFALDFDFPAVVRVAFLCRGFLVVVVSSSASGHRRRLWRV